MNHSVILFNGPPRAGKSTACKQVESMFPDEAALLGVSWHLKRMVHGIYLGRAGWDLDPDVFDYIKGEPQDFLGGRSWRQIYIHYHETVIKPLHGPDWLVTQFVKTMRTIDKPLITVPDCGFRPEGFAIIKEVGVKNVLLIRLHKIGATFTGDSRSYISLKDFGVEEVDMENVDGHPALMRLELKLIISKWRNKLSRLEYDAS